MDSNSKKIQYEKDIDLLKYDDEYFFNHTLYWYNQHYLSTKRVICEIYELSGELKEAYEFCMSATNEELKYNIYGLAYDLATIIIEDKYYEYLPNKLKDTMIRVQIEKGKGIARTVNDLRQEVALSQTDMAVKFGIPVRTVKGWGKTGQPPFCVADYLSEQLYRYKNHVNTPIDRYTRYCLRFAQATHDLDNLDTFKYIHLNEFKYHTLKYIQFDVGPDLSWAFHLNPAEIKAMAPAKYIDFLRGMIEDVGINLFNQDYFQAACILNALKNYIN